MITKIAKFVDRTEAGQLLAAKLKPYANRSDVIVLGLPRRGVPVAFEVAKALDLPLDICLVRKLGVPGHLGNRSYRGDRPSPNLKDRTVILVDDGIATGASMRAAIAVLQEEQPRSIIIATPVAPSSTCEKLKAEVDQVVCLMMPEPFYAIAFWYDYFPQTTDEEVRKLLSKYKIDIPLVAK
jgi:putative phosphoribosyl transferase